MACEACPRLVAHRAAIGETRRRAYRDQVYWSRPLPGFGDPLARLLIVGLAPGAHGANRTGRVFTGDRSGDFLYAALHRAGLASQATSVARDDGLELRDTFMTMPVRCVPPDNRPSPEEIRACASFFEREIALVPNVRAVLALGAIALAAACRLMGTSIDFAHGAKGQGVLGEGAVRRLVQVFASYHVSQQNTQTGRLTPAMFDAVLREAHAAATSGKTSVR